MGSPITRRGPNNSTRRKARTPMQVVDPDVGGRASRSGTPPHAEGGRCLPMPSAARQCCAKLCRAKLTMHSSRPPMPQSLLSGMRWRLCASASGLGQGQAGTGSGWVRAGPGAVSGAGEAPAGTCERGRRLRSGGLTAGLRTATERPAGMGVDDISIMKDLIARRLGT